MKTEGLVTRGDGIDFLRVVGAKMGHKVDPPSAQILKAFHDERAVKGLDLNPKRVQFVTYTLKYNQAPVAGDRGDAGALPPRRGRRRDPGQDGRGPRRSRTWPS